MLNQLLCWLLGHKWILVSQNSIYPGVVFRCARCAHVGLSSPDDLHIHKQPDWLEAHTALREEVNSTYLSAGKQMKELREEMEHLRQNDQDGYARHGRLEQLVNVRLIALGVRVTNVEAHIDKLWQATPEQMTVQVPPGLTPEMIREAMVKHRGEITKDYGLRLAEISPECSPLLRLTNPPPQA